MVGVLKRLHPQRGEVTLQQDVILQLSSRPPAHGHLRTTYTVDLSPSTELTSQLLENIKDKY